MPNQYRMPDGSVLSFNSNEEASNYRKQNFPNFNPESRAIPQNLPPSKTIANPTSMRMIKQISENPNQITANDIKTAKNLAELNNLTEKPLNPETMKHLAEYDTAIRFMREMARIKNKGFGGKPVDTGPIVGANFNLPFSERTVHLLPNTVSQAWSQYVEGLSPYDATARARLRQMHLETLGPKRKYVTGSQAGEKELTRFIMPLLPGDEENDANFNALLLQAAQNTYDQKIENIRKLQAAGYKIDADNESQKLIQDIIDLIPEEQRPGYKRPAIMPAKRRAVTLPPNTDLIQKEPARSEEGIIEIK